MQGTYERKTAEAKGALAVPEPEINQNCRGKGYACNEQTSETAEAKA